MRGGLRESASRAALAFSQEPYSVGESAVHIATLFCIMRAKLLVGGAAVPTLYRAEVIGSLLRPSYLKEARQQWESGRLSARDFKRIEDCAVDKAIALQQQAGVDVVTRRRDAANSFLLRRSPM